MDDTPQPQPPRAVVVDDAPLQRALLTSLLQREGCRVAAFEGAEAALAALDPACPPDLIVTDLHMPGIDGWRFCRLLRSAEYAAYNRVPVLVVSATFAGEEAGRITVELGADAFLAAPVDAARFGPQVRALLAGTRLPERPRVLLVEDCRSLAGALGRAFDGAGYVVDTAGSLQEAQAALARGPFDVAVLDYHLPDGKGDTLLDAVHRACPDGVCLMMTTDPAPSLALDWMRRGAADYLRKPFEPSYLLECCARARRERALLRVEEHLEIRTQQLRESERRLRTTLDLLPNVAVQAYDADLNITYWNPTAVALFGWDPDEVLGRCRTDLMTDVMEGERLRRACETATRTGQASKPFELRTRRRDGSEVATEATIIPVPSGEGGSTCMCLETDLTARRRAESALNAKNEELRHYFGMSLDLLCIADTEGRFLRLNPEWAQTLGYPLEDLEGQRYLDFVHPDDLPATLEVIQRLKVEEEIQGFENRYRCKDGSYRWIEWRSRPQGNCIYAVARDVTARKRAEEETRTLLRFQDQMLDTAAIWINTLDAEGRVTLWNRAAEAISGYAREEVLGHGRIWEWLYPDPEDRARIFRPVLEIIQEGRQLERLETVIRRKDGELRKIAWHSNSLVDVAGQVVGSIAIGADVTDQRRAEEALRQSEARFDLTLQAVNDGLWDWDLRTGTAYFSPLYYRMLGYEPRAFPADYAHWRALVHPEDLPGVETQVQASVANGGPYEVQMRLRCQDGSWKWILGRGSVVGRDAEGRATRMVGTHVDITERKRTEESLHLFRDLVAHSSEAIGMSTPEGRHYYQNEAFDRLFGTREVVGDHPIATVYEDPSVGEEVFRTLREGKPWRGEARMRAADGSIRDIFLRAYPIQGPEGRVLALVGLHSDVTERNRAERALRESEARLRALIDAMPDSVCLKDGEGRWLEANEAHLALFGLTGTPYRGRTDAEMVALAASMAETLRACAATDQEAWQAREPVRCERAFPAGPGGGSRVLDMVKVPVHRADGSRQGLVVLGHDISELRALEAERLDLERRLLHTQKLESLGVLAGGIAHDFNNLLMAMLGNLELALMDLSPLSAARQHLERIQASVRRAADLTRQMLAYSGRGAFHVQPMDLNALVAENVHLLRAAVSRTVLFRMELDEALPPVVADPGQVQQVIMNLVTNASEAIGDQSGVVTLATRVREATSEDLQHSRCPEPAPPGRYVELDVSDTGCGMDAEVLARLFDPFFTTKFTGRGLGMSAILGIVKGHGGAIFLDSAPGRGTSVRVLLPVLATAPTSVDSAPEPPPPQFLDARRGTLLLVDDEEMLRETGEALLSRLGFRVLLAEDGLEALKVLQGAPENLVAVILDLTMPGMDGLATLEALRAARPDLPVLLCSGFDPEETLARVPDRSHVDFLQKPYTFKDLKQALARVLGEPAP